YDHSKNSMVHPSVGDKGIQKSQIASTKTQTNLKTQIRNRKSWLGIWSFGRCLLFGICVLGFLSVTRNEPRGPSRPRGSPPARAQIWGYPKCPSRPCSSAGLARGAADGIADLREGRVGVRAQRGDRRDAHDDNQREHDGVFNCRRAVFLGQEILDAFHELTHCSDPFEKTRVPQKNLGLLVRPICSAGPFAPSERAIGGELQTWRIQSGK